MTAEAAASATPVLTPRRWAVWSVVMLGGAATVLLSANALVASPPATHALSGVLVLLLATWIGQHWPVPLGDDVMFLSAVPIVCAAVMYGAAVAALMAATVYAVEDVRRRIHPLRIAFNTAVFALMGGAAGLAAHVHPENGVGLVVAVVLAAAAQYVTNTGLVALMIAQARIREFADIAWSITRIVTVPFALSLSIVPLFIVAWTTRPYIALTAAVPLAAVVLHLRSLEASRQATALSLTDPLTGLGNRRHLSERLQRELDRCDASREPLSVCVLDVDGFKGINDSRGHPAGDDALVAVAGALRQGGEAFRLGGDEFVLLLPSHGTAAAAEIAAAVGERVRVLELAVSVGTATYDGDGNGRNDLLRVADEQLYALRATRR